MMMINDFKSPSQYKDTEKPVSIKETVPQSGTTYLSISRSPTKGSDP